MANKTIIALKRANEKLKKENAKLKEKIHSLEQKSISSEDELILKIMKLMPFSIWACDRNFIIKLWSGRCETFYGYNKEEAVGKNYLELFVAEDEKYISKTDCISIIDKDMKFYNCYAEDETKENTKLKLLTNCLRVKHNDEYLQAEMGLEVSDFEEKKEIYKNTLKKGIEKRMQEKAEREQARLINEFAETTVSLQFEKGKINKSLDEKIQHYSNLNNSDDKSVNREYIEDELEKFKSQKVEFNKQISELEEEMKDLIKNESFKNKLDEIIRRYKE